MNTLEIKSYLRKIHPSIEHNVYAANRLPIYVETPSYVISNLDTDNKPGSHWIAMYIDRNGVGQYFDSYGRAPTKYHFQFLKRNSRRWYYNTKRIQNDLTSELLAPYNHVLQVSGKQMRVKIALALNHWLRVPEDKLRYIVDTLYMLHNGTLLADDIQDKAELRRGIPAAHCIYGVPLTLNAVMHVVFLALQAVMKLGPKATEIYAEDVLEAFRGQGIELYWRENFVCPTEEEYKTMVEQKTGRMLALSARILQLFSDYKTDLTDFVLQLGYYFQIRDDYCNLKQQDALEEWPGPEDTQAIRGANFCDDITEGKFSFPMIHAMKSPEAKQILYILRQRTQDYQLKKYCVSLMDKVGSFQYTRDVLSELDRAARAEVARLGGNPEMEAVLDELLSWKD